MNLLPRPLLFLVLGLIGLSGSGCTEKTPPPAPTFTVMAWNILHGGRDIPEGPAHVIEIIRALDPDVVLMVETYGSGPMIAEALGYHLHLVAPAGTAPDDPSVNLAVFSRFPFGERLDSEHPFYLGGREILIGNQRVRLLSNWFHYLPWHDAPETMGLSAAELLAWEQDSGRRYEMIRQVRPVLTAWAAEADSIPLILGGDMNSPSHLDWGPNTRAQHAGLVVPWYATKNLAELGMRDSYREIHPDPGTHPGITWDSPGRTDEHRIDYIFYRGKGLQALASESYQAFLGDSLRIGERAIPYPSDHGLVMTTFALAP
ncbi:MAG: endonuclease/exonuclease/phosphatase family protein [Bacteroidetes bacterium]|nr:MAG: endonuclease/exonuclease/phosphatase family protein [Bacteroidota bacterium]